MAEFGAYECEVVAVVPTLRESARLWRALESVKASLLGREHRIVVVINDPSAPTEPWTENGVTFTGAGLNLGWAGGLHAGLLGTTSDFVWAIQDDMTVEPSTFTLLRNALLSDARLAVVRPRNGAHQQGQLDPHRGAVIEIDVQGGEHLPSSGQLIRRSVWEAIGGYEPLLWPWGYVDVDFTRSVTGVGGKCAHVTSAVMHHEAGGSTNWHLRAHALARNDELHRFKWDDDLQDPRLVSAAVIAEARRTRGRPREASLVDLQRLVGLAATDAYMSVMTWLPDEPYEALRRLRHDPESRRAFTHRLRSAATKRLGR